MAAPHPNPPALDLTERPFTIQLLDAAHPRATEGWPVSVYEGPATFTARPLPYRKAWGHRYEVTLDGHPEFGSVIALVGPGSQFADYVPGDKTITSMDERFELRLLERHPTKDPLPTASELQAAVTASLGVTEVRFR